MSVLKNNTILSETKKLSRDRILIGVFFIFIFQMWINYIWLKIDNFPLFYDYGCYFQRSLEIYYASKSGVAQFLKAVFAIGPYADAYHPQRILLPLLSLPWYYLFGTSADVAVMSTSTFLAVALFSTYAISAKLFDRPTAFLSVFVLSTSPGFFVLYRRYSPEFAATAMVALTAYCLLRTSNFLSRKNSIIFGASFGLAMLTKEMAFPFIISILVYTLYKAELFSFRAKYYFKKNKEKITNFLLALFMAALLTSPLYLFHKKHILYQIFSVAYSDEMRKIYNMAFPFSFQGLLYYPKTILNFSFLTFNTALFILGAAFCIKKKINNKSILLSFVIGAYIILSLAYIKNYEYSTALLIPMAIFASFAVNHVFSGKDRIFILTLVIFFNLTVFLCRTFPIKNLPQKLTLKNYDSPSYAYPIRDNWRLDEIVDYIYENSESNCKFSFVHIGTNLAALSPVTLTYVSTLKGAKIKFRGHSSSIKQVFECDFVINKGGNNQGFFYSEKQARELLDRIKIESSFFKLPKTFVLPDGSTLEIYKKRGSSYL